MKRDVFFIFALSYPREFAGLLYPLKVTTMLLKVKNKKAAAWRDAYKSHKTTNVKKIYIPKPSKGRFGNIASPTLLDHLFYSFMIWIYLPYILMHKKVVIVVPPFFVTTIIPILKLFGKRVYIISKDSESAAVKQFKRTFKRKIFYSIMRLLEIMSIKLATKTFAFSQRVAKDYRRFTSNVSTMPTGADIEHISKIEAKRLYKEFTISYMGGFEPWRGLDLLITAFKRIKQKGVKAKLLLMGGGPECDRLKKMAENDTDVVFAGYVSHDKAMGYCKGSDLLVLPNRNCEASRTTSSIKVFEYIACEIPSMVADSGEHADWVRKLGAGLIVKDNSDSMEKGILKAMKNKKLYAKMKHNAAKNKWAVDYRKFKEDYIKEVQRE